MNRIAILITLGLSLFQQSKAIAAEHDAAGVTPITRFEKWGDGPVPMVMVPGFTCDASVFAEFAQRNSGRYTMYAVTLPGFGGTAAPAMPDEANPDPVFFDNAANALLQFVRENQLNQPVILGHSIGGMLAMRVYSENPGMFRSAVFVDSMPTFPPGPPGETAAQRKERTWTQMGPIFKTMTDDRWKSGQVRSASTLVTDPKRAREIAEMCGKTPRDIAVRYILEVSSVDYHEQAKKITGPTLLLAAVAPGPAGQTDAVHQLWNAIGDEIPGCKMAIFDQTRHFIFYDRPTEFDAAVNDFLSGKEPSTQPMKLKP